MSTALPVRVERDLPSRPNAAPADGIPSAFYLEAIRAHVPSRSCEVCGDPVGAARLTLHRGATACAWCAAHHGQGGKTHERHVAPLQQPTKSGALPIRQRHPALRPAYLMTEPCSAS